MFRVRSHLFALALLACGAAPAVASDSNQPSPSVTLEIIVKFSRGSDAGRRIDGIFKENPQNLSGLADLQTQLRASTGFELIPERVTSGRELILRIPEKPILERLKARITKLPEVVSAELIPIQEENPRLPESMLLLHFRRAGDEIELLNKAYAEHRYAGPVQALAARICFESGVPVLGSAKPDSGLGLTVDRYALLEKLVAQLNALDEVDYAQPNASVQFIN